jgi:hypothetical protein
VLVLSEAHAADHLGADSLAVVDHHSLPFWCQALGSAGVVVVVAVVVVFHTHRCAAEVAGSCQADLEGDLD